jgi:ribulose bisphosphate carboxylase small subunit
LDRIEQLVTDSLRGDWIVRVEHTNKVSRYNTSWQSWGKALFAIKDPTPVIDAIMACRANYPNHAIRLHAEKVNPAVRFVYWVYQPNDEPASAMPTQSTVTSPAANTTPSLIAKNHVARSRVWRYLTLVGTLFAAALLLEENAIAGTTSIAVQQHTNERTFVSENTIDSTLGVSKRAS